ncbi:MAG: ACP S-malonyltransferase [Holosporales bacterium]|nr:ACP S-malonyltransferase [Holosporales bacterium]
MGIALIFPGQGSQKIGMCSSFITGFKTGIEVMEEIEDAISFKISKLIFDGPIDELTQTQNAQMAIFAASIATFCVLQQEFGFNIARSVKYMAGHSLGEYTALCAASAIPIIHTAILIQKRSEIMQKALDGVDSCMVAILGLTVDKVESLLGKNAQCVVANDNSNTQVVISGTATAVKKVAQDAMEAGAKKIVKLNTSGAFHSQLMHDKTTELEEFIRDTSYFNAPIVPVIMNVTAKPIDWDTAGMGTLLAMQISNRVRWRETIKFMAENGINKIVEIGPGRTLTNLSKRAYPGIKMTNIETVPEMEAFVRDE